VDGKYIASGDINGKVVIWDGGSFQRLTTLNEHTDTVRTCSFSIDSKYLVTVSLDLRVIVWQISDWRIVFSTLLPDGVRL
jgi:WD40 repeat protein